MPTVRLLRLSSPYSTRPVGFSSPHWFTNAVGMINTDLTPDLLLTALLKIEAGLGRVRRREQSEYRDRPIDLDIIYYEDFVISSPRLKLPHPEVENRLFVLMPLAEIASDCRHPVSGFTAVQMLDRLMSTLKPSMTAEQMIKKGVWRRKKGVLF